MHHHKIVDDIRLVNPYRSPDNVRRRLLKVLEEVGEASEAYLSRTGQGNYKNKTWDDYAEEAVDTLIVLVDIALTEQEGFNFPPAALLPNHLLDAMQTSKWNLDMFEDRKFAIVAAVARADERFRKNDVMGFYGAMGRAIKAAADIVFARDFDSSINEVSERSYRVVTRKLAKWSERMTGSQPTHSAIPATAPVVDNMKDFMESIEDKHA